MYNVNINNVGVDRVGEKLHLFGKLEWTNDEDDSLIKVSFDNFPCNLVTDTLNLLERLPFMRNELIEIPGLYIRYEGLERETFKKAIRQLFAIAVASTPSELVDVTLNFKEEWEEE